MFSLGIPFKPRDSQHHKHYIQMCSTYEQGELTSNLLRAAARVVFTASARGILTFGKGFVSVAAMNDWAAILQNSHGFFSTLVCHPPIVSIHVSNDLELTVCEQVGGGWKGM